MKAERAETQRRLGSLESGSISSAGGVASALVMWLVEFWAWGVISSIWVQKIAGLACIDINNLNERNKMIANCSEGVVFESIPELCLLAGIGDNGQWPSNCHRDLIQLFQDNRLTKPHSTGIPMRVFGKTKNVYHVLQQVILWPHMLLSDIPTLQRRLEGYRVPLC